MTHKLQIKDSHHKAFSMKIDGFELRGHHIRNFVYNANGPNGIPTIDIEMLILDAAEIDTEQANVTLRLTDAESGKELALIADDGIEVTPRPIDDPFEHLRADVLAQLDGVERRTLANVRSIYTDCRTEIKRLQYRLKNKRRLELFYRKLAGAFEGEPE